MSKRIAGYGGSIISLDSGFALLDGNGQILRVLANRNVGRSVNTNDGRVDHRGRFWSGTMAKDWGRIGFSPDDQLSYFNDFANRTVFAYPFDLESGALEMPSALITLEERDGKPEGLTVHAEGHVWVAPWDGWCVAPRCQVRPSRSRLPIAASHRPALFRPHQHRSSP